MVFLVHLSWHIKTNLISHNKSLHPQINEVESGCSTKSNCLQV